MNAFSYAELHGCSSADSLEDQLAELNARTSRILERLDDPEYPHAGRAFLARLEETGHSDCAPRKYVSTGLYISFNRTSVPSFVHRIDYKVYQRAPLHFMLSRVHEGAHAMAWARSAVLHASPFNAAAVCVPAPLDFAMLAERVEQDAYAKQAWIGALVAAQQPDVHAHTQDDALPTARFAELRAQAGHLREALVLAAGAAMQTRHSRADAVRRESFADYYHRVALEAYERQIDILREDGVTPVFMRVEARDIAGLGQSFGPNIFADDARFLRLPALNASNAALVARLNRKYGIERRGALPGFTAALARHGFDRASFLAWSRNPAPRAARTPGIQMAAQMTQPDRGVYAALQHN